MTKLVPVRSVEHGLRRALSILDDTTALAAIEEVAGVRRSVSLLRKCADPDNDRHHLQLRYAVALDSACLRAGHLTPLLDVYQYLVETHARASREHRTSAEEKLLHAVLSLHSALGELSQTVSDGLHDEGPAGDRLTNQEKHAIHEALEAVDQHSEAIKRVIAG